MKYSVKKEMILMDFLLQNYNRKNAKNYLKFKQVQVNGQVVTQFDYRLKENDIVEIGQVRKPSGLDIIYEDNEIIVINKPSGLLSMSDGKEKEKTAYHLVREYLKTQSKDQMVFIVHRLDRETSGVLMFCKNEQLKYDLQDKWNDLVYKRGYVAMVEGVLQRQKGTLKDYLNETKTHQVYVDKQGKGKLAITHYQVLKQSKRYTLVEIYLDTGRKNQIRVQFQNIGHSLAGDRKYGAKSNPIKRLALHAHVFAFEHPYTQKKMEFEAKVPQEFERV